MRLSLAAVTLLLVASSGCAMQAGPPRPSPWAVTYPDTSAVTSGRVVRFAGNYGLTGPSPAVAFREVNGTVTGEVLVWFRRGGPAGSAAADSARLASTYGCTTWVKGYQEGDASVCRVPEHKGAVNWGAQLARVDSLALGSKAAEQGGGRRGDPIAPPPPPTEPGVTQLRKRECMDGGNWYIETRDARGTRRIASPQPGTGCLPADGPAKSYDQAGWQLLKDLIATVQ